MNIGIEKVTRRDWVRRCLTPRRLTPSYLASRHLTPRREGAKTPRKMEVGGVGLGCSMPRLNEALMNGGVGVMVSDRFFLGFWRLGVLALKTEKGSV